MVVLLLAGFVSASAAPETAFGQRRRRSRQAGEDATPGPNVYKSRNFHVMTDLSREDSEELLERLETMLTLVSAYWGRRNTRPIEMYVIDDFENWPESQLAQMDSDGVAMVRGGGGLTITQVISSGNKFVSKAVVYAGSDHGTPQHEAVHAYCGHAFGTTGPVWYSEGMAEVGQYWKKNDKSVNAPQPVIDYLQSGELKELDAIVNNPLETTGDSWQNYAWRWALCHLLGFNENYTKRFKPLGLALLAKQDVDFWQVYGSQAQEISFEYALFLQDMAPGYRCDLCSWDWKTRFKGLQGSALVQASIRADRGWQASRLKVFEGTAYSVEASGNWTITEEGDDVSPEGTESGEGRLVGVIFHDYTLSEPFDLPADGTWTAPADGDLFLRCHDDWGSIADNSGAVRVKLKLADESAAASE
ncbi:MAG: hypothetical protein DWQ29_05395 [Planctomycetota bacterium]|nr:MAG: hypothetical protein DWQ29_05395 [Planctomycetota bacterium]